MPDIDLWNIDLLDTHLHLLDTDIPNKHFVCLQEVLKTSSRHAFKMPSRLARCLRDIFERCLQDVFKTFSRRLGRRKIVTLKTCWRGLQEMSWRPTNVCWVARLLDIMIDNGAWKYRCFLLSCFLSDSKQ